MKLEKSLTVAGLALAAVLGTTLSSVAQADPLDKKSPKIAHGMYRDRGKSSPKIAHGIRTGYPMSYGIVGRGPVPRSFEELLPVAADLVNLYSAAMDAGEFELADEVALDVKDLVDAYDRWLVCD